MKLCIVSPELPRIAPELRPRIASPEFEFTIDTFRKRLGETAGMIMTAIDDRIEAFFVQALQLDLFTLEMGFE